MIPVGSFMLLVDMLLAGICKEVVSSDFGMQKLFPSLGHSCLFLLVQFVKCPGVAIVESIKLFS